MEIFQNRLDTILCHVVWGDPAGADDPTVTPSNLTHSVILQQTHSRAASQARSRTLPWWEWTH